MVPEQFRKAVEIHVKTVFSLKRWQARQSAAMKKKGDFA